ncbi:thiol:disulfide interchange protein DsbA/DsbL [Streptomyces sp. TLI_146]|uniref:thiol:disulfide interchange protein DsbA/DsbL n=1 Tax=Streptomyces sp. TLI_146 TaxID=1938858 RepID=UPI000C6FFAC4|nr:thiol:disulfide interchange protein DsbA/DsbL [Streptomyces sp. TLI_146]PKV89501.1 thiol:disulfide interchange protein DsbA [Streptomyces sp. TLI_146]
MADEIVSGGQYVELSPPAPRTTAGTVEVWEFFWYGDPHSYAIEPTVRRWAGRQTGVTFVRVPAPFGGPWDGHAQMHFALEALAHADTATMRAVYEAVQHDGKRLAEPDEQADFLARLGVDRARYLAVLNSFGVKGQLAAAKAQALRAGVQGVPTFLVNGKYRTDLKTAGSAADLVRVVEGLVAMARTR